MIPTVSNPNPASIPYAPIPVNITVFVLLMLFAEPRTIKLNASVNHLQRAQHQIPYANPVQVNDTNFRH